MTIDKNTKILIVGLGLMGGCYAMSLSKQGYHVRAITLEQSSIDYAINKKIIEYGTTELDADLIAESDLIVFSLYPNVFIKWINENQKYFSPGTLLTDVTGVKGSVVYKIQEILRPDVEFIPAHPMAGREVYGVQNSDDKIFLGANYIVTPTNKNTSQAIKECKRLGEILGFKTVSTLSPEEHDDMVGFLSQLTHCIAVALMTCNNTKNLEAYTGDSFRDLTRIAKINDVMWSELFMMNKPALLKHMNEFEQEFDKFRKMLMDDDVEGMKRVMRHSAERRKLFDKKL